MATKVPIEIFDNCGGPFTLWSVGLYFGLFGFVSYGKEQYVGFASLSRSVLLPLPAHSRAHAQSHAHCFLSQCSYLIYPCLPFTIIFLDMMVTTTVHRG